MQSAFYIPDKTLQPYVQGFVYAAVGNQNEDSLQEFDLFPVGHSLITFILDEQHQLINTQMDKSNIARLNFTGQLDRYHHLMASPSSMVYVLFKPFGAYKLLGVPQYLLKNQCIGLSELLGNSVNDLSAKLEENAKNPLAVITILQQWLLIQHYRNEKTDISRISFVCNQILQSDGQATIYDLNALCGISKSSMEQYFNEQIGLTPKMYSKIVRFNQINKYLKNEANASWIDIVNRFGYADQSHFIREFKYFAGYTPSQMHLSYQNIAQHISSLNSL